MGALSTWVEHPHTADGRTLPTWRKGSGPGVVVLHESPGLTPEVVAFGEGLVEAGLTVVLPHLFGSAERPPRPWAAAVVVPRLCLSREFALFATGATTPLAGWLRDLARALHAECGGPGVGAVGMCVTGGFALAMMLEPAVVAPVVAQPAVPVPLTARHAADVGLAPGDLSAVAARARAGCPVLGVRYRADVSTGTRFATLREALGDAFVAVELPGRGHATLTHDRHPEATARVIDFLRERLGVAPR
jgi:dienelactone hydrolase